MSGHFVDGPDPENPDDLGVDPEKIDELIDKVSDKLRQLGLYSTHFAVMTPPEEELGKYGVRSKVDEPMLLLGALSIGDLAWKRIQTQEEHDRAEMLRVEQDFLESDVDEIKRKYQEGQE